MAIEAICWITSGATKLWIPGGIIPQECRSLARGISHTELGLRWGDDDDDDEEAGARKHWAGPRGQEAWVSMCTCRWGLRWTKGWGEERGNQPVWRQGT